jgi:hypothetical protein
MEPKEITDLDLAFPGPVIDLGLLPKWEDIPEEFRNRDNEWAKAASKLFFKGGKGLAFKEGVAVVKAKRHIAACLRSYQPKHEHKIAGVGWLLSQWLKSSKVEEL